MQSVTLKSIAFWVTNMALYDQRTFRESDQWWAAEVHGQSGFGWGAGPHDMTKDTVYFTSLTTEKDPSRVIQMPVGKLNVIDHASIVAFLFAAPPFPDRLEMSPYNTPDEAEFRSDRKITDGEGLRWIVRYKKLPRQLQIVGQPDALLHVVCLDDSALRRDVFLQDSNVYSDLIDYVGDEAAMNVILAVKSTFEKLEAPQLGDVD